MQPTFRVDWRVREVPKHPTQQGWFTALNERETPMTSSIQDTIVSAVPVAREGQYRQYVDAAVRALTRREQEIAAALLDYAAEQGASRAQVAEFLGSIGLPNGRLSAVSNEASQPTSGRDVDLESLERATSTMAEATRAMLVAVQALRNQSS